VATCFGHLGHPQANGTQNLKRMITSCVHKFQVVWIPFTPVSKSVNKLALCCQWYATYTCIMDFICGNL